MVTQGVHLQRTLSSDLPRIDSPIDGAAPKVTEEKNLSSVPHVPGKITYQHRLIPTIGPHNVLVQIHYTGICGSDVHYWKNGYIGRYIVTEPMVLGHESSGIVVAIGSDVRTLIPGDRVAIEPGVPCRRCTRCRGGKYNLCPSMQFAAATPPVHGTLTGLYAAPEDFCYQLAEHVTLQEGTMVEPLAVAVHVVRQADVKPGQSVVVFGAGPIGLLCCAVAKVFGASKVACIDLSKDRLEFAMGYVATHIYLSKKQAPEDAALAILEESGVEDGFDAAIDATGAEPCIQTCVHVVRNGGTYVQAGMGASEVLLPIGALCGKEITVRGSFRYQEGDYALATSMLAERKLSVQELVTAVIEFHEAEKAFEMVSQGIGIKTLVRGPGL